MPFNLSMMWMPDCELSGQYYTVHVWLCVYTMLCTSIVAMLMLYYATTIRSGDPCVIVVWEKKKGFAIAKWQCCDLVVRSVDLNKTWWRCECQPGGWISLALTDSINMTDRSLLNFLNGAVCHSKCDSLVICTGDVMFQIRLRSFLCSHRGKTSLFLDLFRHLFSSFVLGSFWQYRVNQLCPRVCVAE